MKSIKKKKDWLPLIPLIFLCSIYPMITRLFLYDSGYEQYDWFDSQTQVSDLFLGWKMIALEITGAILLIVLLYMVANRTWRLQSGMCIWLLAGYAGLTLLSTLFSKYSMQSWSGAYAQFEPVWCTLIYVLIVAYIYAQKLDSEHIRIVMIALAVGGLILGVIGLSQFLGYDPVTNGIGKYLIMPARFRDSAFDSDKFRGITYMTLYNPNYVGTYVTMLLPLFLSLSVNEQNRKLRFLYGTDCILLFVDALGCKSESARWGVSLTLVLVVVFWFRHISVARRKVVLVAVCSAMLFLINCYYTVDAGYTSVEAATDEQPAASDIQELVPVSENLHSIETLDDHVHVAYADTAFNISYTIEDHQFIPDMWDDNGAAIDFERVGDEFLYQVTDARFTGIQFAPVIYQDDSYGLELLIDGKEWDFTNERNGEPGYYYYNTFGKFDKITSAENYIFQNRGSFGNGRGFIWGETLPLLKKTVILGTGADSFALVFPQDNYVEKYLNGYESIIISKPHNMYLQLGVQNGILALCLFLLAIGLWMYRLFRAYRSNVHPEWIGLQIGILISVAGYLFTGLVNDVTICLSPIFWCMIGLGMILTDLKVIDRKKR